MLVKRAASFFLILIIVIVIIIIIIIVVVITPTKKITYRLCTEPNETHQYGYRTAIFGIATPSSMQWLIDPQPDQLRKNASNNRLISKQCGPQSAAPSSNFSWRLEKKPRKIITNSCLRSKNMKEKNLPVRRSLWLIIMVMLEMGCQTAVSSKRKALFTPWNRVLLEKLTVSQLVKNFPAFYGTRRFIITFTSARHLSLS
jgi:hypothetical protein